jgi:hypothetical protein
MSVTFQPSEIHGGHSQLYRFDRIDVNDIAWFRSPWNATEIPSAPIRLTSSVHRGGGNGHFEHGNGNGYGHNKHETPEPSTLLLLVLGMAAVLAAKAISDIGRGGGTTV